MAWFDDEVGDEDEDDGAVVAAAAASWILAGCDKPVLRISLPHLALSFDVSILCAFP